jgi:hypothetical protein
MLAGRYHLLGGVEVVGDKTFRDITGKVLSVFNFFPSLKKIIIPPLPRYIGGGCCMDSNHSTNVQNPDHQVKMLEKVKHVRKVLREELLGSNVTNYWIPDIIETLGGGGGGGGSPSRRSRDGGAFRGKPPPRKRS